MSLCTNKQIILVSLWLFLLSFEISINAQNQQFPPTCGDCHCIVDSGEDCPYVTTAATDENLLQEYRALIHTNPFTLDCDPYVDDNCTTVPEQTLTDSETAVCAIQYNNLPNEPDDACPTSYQLISVETMQQVESNPNLYLTHVGACGTCSSLQDLSVYMEHPDLQSYTRDCAFLANGNSTAATECFVQLGFSESCAKIWVYNGLNTGRDCTSICIQFFLSGEPNNGPAPMCSLAECLMCDEVESGPIFQRVAGRSMRRSGLLSSILRNCSEIARVDHLSPCDAVSKPDMMTSGGQRYDQWGGVWTVINVLVAVCVRRNAW